MGQSHSHFIVNFEAVSLGCCLIVSTSSCNDNSSHCNVATGFGERPVQQVLVFALFLNDHVERQDIVLREKCAAKDNEISENKILGCAREARGKNSEENEVY